jgi:hypothetical protein
MYCEATLSFGATLSLGDWTYPVTVEIVHQTLSENLSQMANSQMVFRKTINIFSTELAFSKHFSKVFPCFVSMPFDLNALSS